MTLEEAKQKFLHEKEVQHCTKPTVQSYHYFIKVFIDYKGNCEIESITQEDIEEYALDLYKRDLSEATHHTYLHHLRIFFIWCAKKVTLQFEPAEIAVPRSPKKKLRIYSTEDIRLIYSVECTNVDWLNARNRAGVSLMLDSGLRQMELCSITLQDIDFSAKRVKVRGKGNKERIVPLGNITIALIRQYLHLMPYKESKYLFCNQYGKKLTGNAIKLFVRKMRDQLPFEFSSHKLRHNFATNYCIDKLEHDGTVDTYSLMYIMGHESIETTEKYVHLAREVIASKTHISHVDKVLQGILGIAV